MQLMILMEIVTLLRVSTGLLLLANVWDYSDLCFKSDYQKANHNAPTQWTNQSLQ